MKNGYQIDSWSGQIDSSGRLLVPAGAREAMKWKQGTKVVLESDGDSLRILTRDQFTKEVQSLYGAWKEGDAKLSDELIADRRKEAARERRR